MLVEYAYFILVEGKRTRTTEGTYAKLRHLSMYHHPNTVTLDPDTYHKCRDTIDEPPLELVFPALTVPVGVTVGMMYVCIYGKTYKQYFLYPRSKDAEVSLQMCEFYHSNKHNDTCNPGCIAYHFNWLLHSLESVKDIIGRLDNVPHQPILRIIDWGRMLLDRLDG